MHCYCSAVHFIRNREDFASTNYGCSARLRADSTFRAIVKDEVRQSHFSSQTADQRVVTSSPAISWISPAQDRASAGMTAPVFSAARECENLAASRSKKM